jgi:hypothetical protein
VSRAQTRVSANQGPEHDETGRLVGSHHNVVGRPGSHAGPSPCFFVPVHHAHGGHPLIPQPGLRVSAFGSHS